MSIFCMICSKLYFRLLENMKIWIFTLIVGLFPLVIGAGIGNGFVFLFGLYLVLSSIYQIRQLKKLRRLEEQAKEKISDELEKISGGDVAPITSTLRAKRNEVFYAESGAVNYKFKSNGKMKGHGLKYRVKLAKGVSYNIGGAQVKVSKSWVKEDSGVVSISNQALTYTTDKTAKRFTWGAISKIEANLNGFVITPNNGAVIRFEFDLASADYYRLIALLLLEMQREGAISDLGT